MLWGAVCAAAWGAAWGTLGCAETPPAQATSTPARSTRSDRPHLDEAARADVGGPRLDTRFGPGSVGEALAELDAGTAWPSLDAHPTRCGATEVLQDCITRAAVQDASAGRHALAAERCAALDSATWRAECVFQAAESPLNQAVRGGDLSVVLATVAPSAAMCVQAGRFGQDCLRHLSGELALLAPPGNSTDPDAWAPLAQAIDAYAVALAPLSGPLADAVRAQAWAVALWNSQQSTPQPTGAAAQALPPAAQPHLRAAVVARLASDGAFAGLPLEQRHALARAAMDAPPPAGHPRSTPPVDRRLTPLWARRLPGEEGLVPTPWLGEPMRATADDPDTDLLIVILEEAARAEPAELAVLVEGLHQPQALARWTAARLLGALQPEQPPPLAPDEADPLVLARSR